MKFKTILLSAALLLCWRETNAQMLSVYVGNEPSALADFDTWLGRPTDGVQLHTGYKGWSDYTGSVGWLQGVYASVNRTKFWSIPLIPEAADSSLAAAASVNNSAYTAAWNTIATTLAQGQPTGAIYIRTGWEFNIEGFPWTVVNSSAANYITVYQNFVTTFRSVSDRFVFEWCANISDTVNPADAYPGDAFVDIIGMDFYYNIKWDSKNNHGLDAWGWVKTENYGLQWLVDFAQTHGKPVAYSEWGINNPDGAAYLAEFAKWLKDSPVEVVYQNYWNSNAAFAGMLSNGQYPLLAEEYLKAFGQIPEPSTWVLLTLGAGVLLVLLVVAKRRRAA